MTERHEQIVPQEQEKPITRIKVMRHAPTTWNPLGKLQGRRDNSINPETIVTHFTSLGVESLDKPDVIVVSPLVRTGETADALIDYLHWPTDIKRMVEPRLLERDFAGFEGHTIEQVREKLLVDASLSHLHEEIRVASDVFKVLDDVGIRAAGGELDSEVKNRWHEGLTDLLITYPNQSVLVIGHGGGMVSQELDTKQIAEVALSRDKEGNTIFEIIKGYKPHAT